MQKNKNRQEILLVEFKAPRKLVEAFDTQLAKIYSSRSEAIRTLMRKFVEATKEKA